MRRTLRHGSPGTRLSAHAPRACTAHLREAADLLLPDGRVVLQREAVGLQRVRHLLHAAARLHAHLRGGRRGAPEVSTCNFIHAFIHTWQGVYGAAAASTLPSRARLRGAWSAPAAGRRRLLATARLTRPLASSTHRTLSSSAIDIMASSGGRGRGEWGGEEASAAHGSATGVWVEGAHRLPRALPGCMPRRRMHARAASTCAHAVQGAGLDAAAASCRTQAPPT